MQNYNTTSTHIHMCVCARAPVIHLKDLTQIQKYCEWKLVEKCAYSTSAWRIHANCVRAAQCLLTVWMSASMFLQGAVDNKIHIQTHRITFLLTLLQSHTSFACLAACKSATWPFRPGVFILLDATDPQSSSHILKRKNKLNIKTKFIL